jgi:hypothetical protein
MGFIFTSIQNEYGLRACLFPREYLARGVYQIDTAHIIVHHMDLRVPTTEAKGASQLRNAHIADRSRNSQLIWDSIVRGYLSMTDNIEACGSGAQTGCG